MIEAKQVKNEINTSARHSAIQLEAKAENEERRKIYGRMNPKSRQR
jgi:hypothetical protein